MPIFEQNIPDITPIATPRPEMSAPSALAEGIEAIGGQAINAYRGSIFAQVESDYNELEQTAINSFQEKHSDLDTSLAQGRMSKTEYNVKRDIIYKDAINSFPGLAPEINKIATRTKSAGLQSMFTQHEKDLVYQRKQLGEAVQRERESVKDTPLEIPAEYDDATAHQYYMAVVEPTLKIQAKNYTQAKMQLDSGAYTKERLNGLLAQQDNTLGYQISVRLRNAFRESTGRGFEVPENVDLAELITYSSREDKNAILQILPRRVDIPFRVAEPVRALADGLRTDPSSATPYPRGRGLISSFQCFSSPSKD